jgi:hypothetical protein
MNRKLTRIGIIEYCKQCNHVKQGTGTTLCGLTNQIPQFDYTCDKRVAKELTLGKPKTTGCTVPLLLTLLGLISLLTKLNHYMMHSVFGVIAIIFGVLSVLTGIIWLIVEVIKKYTKE